MNWTEYEHPHLLQVLVGGNFTPNVAPQDLGVVWPHESHAYIELPSHFLALEFELEREIKGGMVDWKLMRANVIEDANQVVTAVFQLADIFTELA